MSANLFLKYCTNFLRGLDSEQILDLIQLLHIWGIAWDGLYQKCVTQLKISDKGFHEQSGWIARSAFRVEASGLGADQYFSSQISTFVKCLRHILNSSESAAYTFL